MLAAFADQYDCECQSVFFDTGGSGTFSGTVSLRGDGSYQFDATVDVVFACNVTGDNPVYCLYCHRSILIDFTHDNQFVEEWNTSNPGECGKVQDRDLQANAIFLSPGTAYKLTLEVCCWDPDDGCGVRSIDRISSIFSTP